jgi:hypothetical protein
MGVVVERICVGAGIVGGRKGVGAICGAQAEAKINVNRMANRHGQVLRDVRNISPLNHKVTENISVTL